eukprot:11518204-Alexandrium_andersonii.AAC.1
MKARKLFDNGGGAWDAAPVAPAGSVSMAEPSKQEHAASGKMPRLGPSEQTPHPAAARVGGHRSAQGTSRTELTTPRLVAPLMQASPHRSLGGTSEGACRQSGKAAAWPRTGTEATRF